MKILNLSFKNLNALKGNWHIDFSDQAFDDGIFAIVGKTGAGKTTILDAICLAIYGKTPRIDTISATQNDLMSLDTGECMAQVELAIRGEIYRFRWEQTRANKKPEGKLQPIKRQISKLTQPYDDGEILESKLKQCGELAIEILGMTFGQFTRSVMLAQGEFSAFLKANSDEKSEILEQITGTEIYSQISLQTFLSHKQKKAKLEALQEKLDGMSVLDDDELNALNEQISTQNQTLATQKAQMAQLETDITHHHEMLRIDTEISDTVHALTAQKQQLPSLQHALKEHTEQKEQAHAKLTQAQDHHHEVMAQIHHMQKFDDDIRHQQTLHDKLQKNHRELTDKIATISQHITDTRTKIADIDARLPFDIKKQTDTQALFAISTTLATHHATLTHLHDDMIHHQTHSQTIKQTLKDKAQLYRHQEQALHQISTQKQQLTQTLTDTFGLHSDTIPSLSLFDELSHMLTQLSAYTKNQQEQKLAQDELAKLTQDINTKKTAIHKHDKAIDEARQDIAQQETLVASLEQNLTLSHELSALKKHFETLKNGTPCPLCGSTTHPNKHQPNPFDDNHQTTIRHELMVAKNRLSQLQHTLKQHEISISSLQSELGYLSERHQHTLQVMQVLQQNTHSNNQALSTLSNKLGTNLNIEPQQLTNHQATYEALRAEFYQISEQENTLHQSIATTKSEGEQLRQTYNTHQHQLTTLTQRIATEQTAIYHVLCQYDTLAHALQDLTTFHVDDKTPLSEANINHVLSQSYAYLGKLSHLISTLNTAKDDVDCLNSLTLTLNHHQVQQRDWHDESAKLHQEIQQLTHELNTLKHQRHTQFGDQNPLTLKHHAEQEQHTAQVAHANTLHAYEQAHTQLTKAHTTIKQHQEQLHKLACAYTKRTNTLNSTSLRTLTLSDSTNHANQHELDDWIKILLDNRTWLQNSLDSLTKQKNTLQNTIDTLLQDIGKNQQRWTDNQTALHTQTNLRDELHTALQDFAMWDKLNALIGSSDGKKYRTFVQGLTLDLLLYHANQALTTMNERYVLCTDDTDNKNALHIYVIDTAQGNEMRSTKNLSGGESFIISLALAIGLSMMNSDKVSIDSLFLDEGFGTLDEETLDVALATLSTLHTNGKMIGIISHVFALKEQITTQINVKKGMHGSSTLSGAGVRPNPQKI